MAIKELEEDVREYLLDMENVVLDMEHIFTKEGKFYFCYFYNRLIITWIFFRI